MPTYQYTCTDCETPLEAVQSFSDDALTVCPTCDGRLRKVYSAVGVVFKGSGFYKNDSRPKEKASSSSGKEGSIKDNAAGKDSGSGKDSTTKVAKGESTGAGPAPKKESAPAAKGAPSKPAST